MKLTVRCSVFNCSNGRDCEIQENVNLIKIFEHKTDSLNFFFFFATNYSIYNYNN